MAFSRSDLEGIAHDLLAEDPAPAVQVRLYREILGLEQTDPRLVKANDVLAAGQGVPAGGLF